MRRLFHRPTELETFWASWLVARMVNRLYENGILLQIRIEPTGRIMSFNVQAAHELVERATLLIRLLPMTDKLKLAIAPKLIANIRRLSVA